MKSSRYTQVYTSTKVINCQSCGKQ